MNKFAVILLCLLAIVLPWVGAQEVDANFPVNEKWYEVVYVSNTGTETRGNELPRTVQFQKKMGGSWYIAVNMQNIEFYLNLDNVIVLKEVSAPAPK